MDPLQESFQSFPDIKWGKSSLFAKSKLSEKATGKVYEMLKAFGKELKEGQDSGKRLGKMPLVWIGSDPDKYYEPKVRLEEAQKIINQFNKTTMSKDPEILEATKELSKMLKKDVVMKNYVRAYVQHQFDTRIKPILKYMITTDATSFIEALNFTEEKAQEFGKKYAKLFEKEQELLGFNGEKFVSIDLRI